MEDVQHHDEFIQGLNALRLGLVSSEQFLRVLRQWIADPSFGLLDRFEKEALVSTEQRVLLESSEGSQHQASGHEPTRSFEVLPSKSREDTEPVSSIAQDLFATELPDGFSGSKPSSPGGGNDALVDTRYRILRKHAEGGLGVVSLAHDRDVNRPVAFKEIKPRYANDLEGRDRFVLEAQLTGGLEHPGIVPIYGLGHHCDGRPYYAMRFVSGDSLQRAIDTFHTYGSSGAKPTRLGLETGDRLLAFRQLLGRFVDVCQAMAYAHHRGVLHRDLKPSNIMLGKYSETLVIDWGLAKLTTQGRSGINIDPEAPLRSDGSMTMDRERGISGTPAYMSPEQARGETQSLGPPSDIYSLGATLYCLLSGRSPQDSSQGFAEVLRRVSIGLVTPAIESMPDVPPALNAICMKAMATDPKERYSDAKQLAEDIERWLGDEPVRVYQEPLAERAARWARKNRAKVSLGLGAMIAGLIVSIGTVVLVAREQSRTEYQRSRAELRFRQARDAVDEYLVNIVDNDHLKSAALKPTRLALLREGLDYYQNFLEDTDSGLELKTPRVEAMLRLAKIQKEMGNLESAEKSYANAFSACEMLFDEGLPLPELSLEYTVGHLELAEIQSMNMARRNESLANLEMAEKLLDTRDRGEQPPMGQAAEARARAFSLLGRWYKESDSFRAMDYARRAVQMHSVLAAAEGASSLVKANWAKSLFEWGVLLGETRRWNDAINAFSDARGIWRTLLEDDAFRSLALESDASISHELAILQDQLARPDVALEMSDETLSTRSLILFREAFEKCVQFAQSLNDHGYRLIQNESSRAEGELLLERALWIRRELLKVAPESNELVIRFAESTTNLASALIQMEAEDRMHRAEVLLRDASDLFASNADQVDRNPTIKKYGSSIDLLIGQVLRKRGNIPDAEKSMQRAIQSQMELVETDPNSFEFLLALLISYSNIGEMKLESEDAVASVEYFRKGSSVADRMIALSPKNLQARLHRCALELNVASAMRRGNYPRDEVRDRLVTSVEQTQLLLQADPSFPSARSILFMELYQLIELHLERGGLNESMELILENVDVDSWTGPDLLDFALLMCGFLVERPAETIDQGLTVDEIGLSIVRLLRRLKSLDWEDNHWLDLPDFDPLRNREDFQSLAPAP